MSGKWSLTLHGAYGTNDDDLRRAINAGITEIHINTGVRLAWRRGLEAAFVKEPDQVSRYKLLLCLTEGQGGPKKGRLNLAGSGSVSFLYVRPDDGCIVISRMTLTI